MSSRPVVVASRLLRFFPALVLALVVLCGVMAIRDALTERADEFVEFGQLAPGGAKDGR